MADASVPWSTWTLGSGAAVLFARLPGEIPTPGLFAPLGGGALFFTRLIGEVATPSRFAPLGGRARFFMRLGAEILIATAAAVVPGPRVLAARAIGPTTVRVTFDHAMLPGPELEDPTNYALAASPGSVAQTVIAATPPTECGDPTFVDLELSGEMTIGSSNYTVTVAANVLDAGGNPLDPSYNSAVFDGFGIPPGLTRANASAVDLTHIRVTFSEEVRQVSALNLDDALRPGNYAITGGPGPVVVMSVATVSAIEVVLTVTGLVLDIAYDLAVSNVRDVDGGNVVT